MIMKGRECSGRWYLTHLSPKLPACRAEGRRPLKAGTVWDVGGAQLVSVQTVLRTEPLRRRSAGTVGGTQSERRVSVYAVAGPEFRSGLRVQPVAVHAAGGAESVSADATGRAEPVSVDAVGRVEPVSVYPGGRAEPESLNAVGRTEPVRGVSVDALRGAEEDPGPGAASRPQRGVADGRQSSRNLQQRASSAGSQRRHGACSGQLWYIKKVLWMSTSLFAVRWKNNFT